jgi:phosphatidylglycerol:prolipoprotein diacylglycerol transferase
MRPILLELPGLGLSLRSYEVCLVLALLLGWVLSLAQAKDDKLPTESMGVAYLLAVLFGVLGARALWLLQHPTAFAGPLSLLQLQAGAMALFGGLLCGGVATWAYVRRLGVPPLAWFDCLGPAILLGMGLESLGAFLAGTDFGVYSPDLAWGVRFPPGSPAHAFQRSTMVGMVAPENPAMSVHPVQLYGLVLAGVGFVWARRLLARREFSGQIITFCVGWFALSRMGVQNFFMARREGLQVGGLDMNIAAGLFFAVVAAYAYRSLSKAAADDPHAHRLWLGGDWTPAEEGGA